MRQKLKFVAFFLLAAMPCLAATPTLKQSGGYTGLSIESTDTGTGFKFQLDQSGPNVVAANDLIVVHITYPDGATPTVLDDQASTYNLATSCADTVNIFTKKDFAVYTAVAAGAVKTITLNFSANKTNVQLAWRVYYNTATAAVTDGTKCTVGVKPTNNTPPNITTGNFTTTVDGDLIDNQIWNEADGNPLDENASTAGAYGTSPAMTGLYWVLRYASAGQFFIQATQSTTTNPGFTFTQVTHDFFATVAVAIKAGSGGSAPGSGIGIIRRVTTENGTTAQNVSMPCSATSNLIVTSTPPGGATGANITSTTDSNSNTYTKLTGSTNAYPQFFYAPGATCSNSNILTINYSTAASTDLTTVYEVTGAASSPIDTAISCGASTLVGNNVCQNNGTQGAANADIADAPDLTPSTSNGLVFTAINMGTGPPSGAFSPTSAALDSVYYTGSGDANYFNNGDGLTHYYNPSTAAINFKYHTANATASSWNAVAFAVKAAPTGGGSIGIDKRRKLEKMDVQ